MFNWELKIKFDGLCIYVLIYKRVYKEIYTNIYKYLIIEIFLPAGSD